MRNDNLSTSWPISIVPTTQPDYVRYFKLSYGTIAPVNIILAIVIIILNSGVMFHYFNNRTKISFVLFLLISFSDIMTAIGNLVFAVGTLVWTTDIKTYDTTMWWCFLVYRVFGLLGYSLSILFNTFLAVLRSIKIYNPFYQVKIWPLIVFGLLYMLLLIGLTGYDIYSLCLNPIFDNYLGYWFYISSIEERSPYPGSTIPWAVSIAFGFSNKWSFIVQYIILALLYFIPVCTVMVSVMIQIHVGVLRTQSTSRSDGNTINDWAHMNITVFLLAAVFLSCNSALSFMTVILYILKKGINDATYYNSVSEVASEVQGAVSTILPLLNAILMPAIIMARNKWLQRDILSRIKSLCGRSDPQHQLLREPLI